MQVEIVPIEEVSGINPDARCERCNAPATKDVIAVFNGEAEYGYTSCDRHASAIAAQIQKEN